jgi:glycolate oxidase FAD binding subunit
MTAALAAVTGPATRLDDPAALAAAAVDGRVPRWVVRPTTAEQLGAVLALTADEPLAVVPRGSGGAQSLGHPPGPVDLVLDLRSMNRVLDYNPDDLTITVQAGITGGDLERQLAAQGQFLPLDPPAAAVRTLGGLAATGASGPLRARHGTMRDLLLGVGFVQADGTLTRGGARVVKSVTGYDVPKLLVGSLGTLGVLAELTLRLYPRPAEERTWLVAFPGLEAAQAGLARLLDSTLQPGRVEWLNAAARTAAAGDLAPASLAVSFGTVPAAVAAQGRELDVLARREGGETAPAPPGFWAAHGRDLASGGGILTLRVGTLPARGGPTILEIERAAAAAGAAPPAVTGCAPVGALLVRTAVPDASSARQLVDRLRAIVGPIDGHVVIQDASPEFRTVVDPWGPIEPGILGLMRDLKATFDPGGRLNPGRFVGGL